MASTPEGKVKKKVKELLNEFGAYHHWPVQTGYGDPCLDCHGCHMGRYFAIETKAPGKKMTPRQELTAGEVRAAGGTVFVIGEKIIGDHYTGIRSLRAWLSNI